MGNTNPRYAAAPDDTPRIKYQIRGQPKPVEVAIKEGSYPKLDVKEWQGVLSQMQLPVDRKKRLEYLPERFKSQIVYEHKKMLNILQEPIISSSEEALEELLAYVRQHKELEKYVVEKNLITNLTNICQTECEGYHDKECLILNIILHCLQQIPQLEIPTICLHEMCQILNPFHIVNFCLVLEILVLICKHQSNEKILRIGLAFIEMKKSGLWDYPFQPFIELLQQNSSIFAVEAVCRFVNYFMEVSSDEDYRIKVKKNFIRQGLPLIYKDIKNKKFDIHQCSYEAMDQMLMEQYERRDKRKRKLLPPDGKPVELSTCAQLCQQLFLDHKNPDQSRFIETVNNCYSQIDAFYELTQDVEKMLSGKSRPSEPERSFKRSGTISEMFDNEEGSLTIRIPTLDFESFNEKLRSAQESSEAINVLQQIVSQTAGSGVNPLTQFIQIAAQTFTELKKNDPVQQALDLSEQKYKTLEIQIRKLYQDKNELQNQISQLKQQICQPQDQMLQTSQNVPQAIPKNDAPSPQIVAPPPPPPGPKGPPPPPPGAKGPPPPPGSKGPPGPPPIGGKVVVTGKPKCNPTKPLKQVPWVIIKEDKIADSVWSKVNDTKIKVDVTTLEDRFAKIEVIPTQSVMVKKPVKVSLLPPERQKNVELVISRLKMSGLVLKEALLSIDFSVLIEDKISMIFNAMPEKEEQEQFLHYQPEDPNNVAAPDQFFMDIASVPQVKVRVEAVKVCHEWKQFAESISAKLEKIQRGVQLQRNDDRIPILLEYALAYGNYMNGQSVRGGASAFKLDIMSQLDDVKAVDNKSNLLMLILEHVESEVRVLYSEDYLAEIDFEFLCKVPSSQVSLDTAELKKQLRIIEKAINSQSDDSSDQVRDVLKPIQEEIDLKTTLLEQSTIVLEKEYKALLSYYCEDPKLSSDEFFAKIERIWTDYKNAKIQMDKVKLQQRKEQDALQKSMVQSQITQSIVEQNVEQDQKQEENITMTQSVRAAPLPGLQKQGTKDVLAELRALQAKKAQLAAANKEQN